MSGPNKVSRSTRGITLTADQLNALATEATLLDGLTATAAELNALDISAAGTAQASKAVVLDGSKGIATITSATITTLTSTTVNAASVNASTAATVTSAGASALAVGLAGATNPAFVVDSSTGSQAAGLKVTGATAAGTVAAAVVSSGTDASLTIDAKGTGTIGIGPTSTGTVTITPATAITGALTPTGGVAAGGGFTFSPRLCHTGGQLPTQTTDGTNLDAVATELYVAEVFIPANCTVTGAAVFNGGAVAGNGKVALFDSTGTRVALSASTAMSGTDAYQSIPFSAPYAAKGPATYYVGCIFDDANHDLNTHILGAFGAGKITGLVYATEAGYASITPPTTFTTGLGPIASLY